MSNLGSRAGAGISRVFREDQEAAEGADKPSAAVSGNRGVRLIDVTLHSEHCSGEQQLVSGVERREWWGRR
jgi:hypothetical protein